MRIAFSSNAFRNYSLCDTIKILADIGYDGLEIMADVPHAYPPDLTDKEKAKIKQMLNETGLRISNINAFMMCAIQDFHHPSWIEPERERREMRLQHTINCIALAKDLGAGTISTEPGGPLNGTNADEAMELFVEGIRRVAPYAREAGVKVLVEPEPGLLIETSSQFKRFIEQVDSDAIGLNCDIGHFFCVGESPAKVIREMKPYAGHFHIEDIASTRVHHHLLPGEGVIDFAEVFQAIQEIGYDGLVTIELYPYQENPIETAQKAFDYVKPLLRNKK